MKKILIPTDFSENAKNAANYGIALFDNEETQFVFLHSIYIHYSTDEVYTNYDVNAKEEAKELFETEKKRILETKPELKGSIEFYCELGDLVDLTSSYTKEEKIDYIVMGTKGASGLTEVLVGSRTASMIKNVECPLVIVPENAKFKKPERILFTTDKELQQDDLNIDLLTDIAKRYKSKIQALYVSKTGENIDVDATFIKYDLDMKLVDIKHDLDVDINADPVEAIENYSKKYSTDMIAMVSTKGNLFHKLFHRSVSKKIAMHTDIPMLIMHIKV